jgi:hypothetical protein
MEFLINLFAADLKIGIAAGGLMGKCRKRVESYKMLDFAFGSD